MVKIHILGYELWECTPEEAKKLWKYCPEDRWRIWTNDEINDHILDSPEQLEKCIASKKAKPGPMSREGK
jgi:hypothetical protein